MLAENAVIRLREKPALLNPEEEINTVDEQDKYSAIASSHCNVQNILSFTVWVSEIKNFADFSALFLQDNDKTWTWIWRKRATTFNCARFIISAIFDLLSCLMILTSGTTQSYTKSFCPRDEFKYALGTVLVSCVSPRLKTSYRDYPQILLNR